MNHGLSGENGGERKWLDGDTGDVDGESEDVGEGGCKTWGLQRGERHNQEAGEFKLSDVLAMFLFSNSAGEEALRSHIEELPLIACGPLFQSLSEVRKSK